MKTGLDLSGVPECVKCGACCFSRTQEYLRVAGVDHDRLGELAESLTEFHGNKMFMKMVDGHCGALTYDTKQEAYLCSIYEKRPDVCHWLERGSGQCAAERHEKSDRPIVLRRKTESDSSV